MSLLVVMFPTTYALGWVFPLVLEAAGGARRRDRLVRGRIYAANTSGTISERPRGDSC